MRSTYLIILLFFSFSCNERKVHDAADSLSINITIDSLNNIKKTFREAGYEDGYKTALIDFMLLNLELEIKNERKTFGEMEEILLKRKNFNEK